MYKKNNKAQYSTHFVQLYTINEAIMVNNVPQKIN